ncbi:MAG: hypothetical protein PHP46_05280, partial [Candidatus Omnitrophica bacterium]|nr:hypothetical protein [Candidatus Omnitrophota bacterium]
MKKDNTNIIDTKYAIVCFMDILGYEDMVQNEKNKNKIYRILKNSLQNLTGNSCLLQQVRSCIKKQLLGDALLFTLDIKKIPRRIRGLNGMSNVEQVFVSYFVRMICDVFLKIIAETKYFVRGGITIGPYYQSYLGDKDNKYIFSKALAEAHELEKKTSVPRIIMSNRLYRYIIQKRRNSCLQNVNILKSIDGHHYLNPYFILAPKNIEGNKKLLKKIVMAVKFQ